MRGAVFVLAFSLAILPSSAGADPAEAGFKPPVSNAQTSEDTQSWRDLLLAAGRLKNTDEKIAAFESLLSSAQNNKDKLRVAGYLKPLYFSENRPGSMIALLEPILEMQAKDNLGSRNELKSNYEYLLWAYKRTNRREDAAALRDKFWIDPNETLSDIMQENQDSSALLHRYSALICPKTIAEFGNLSYRVIGGIGQDIKCSYKHEDEDSSIGLAISMHGPIKGIYDATFQTNHEILTLKYTLSADAYEIYHQAKPIEFTGPNTSAAFQTQMLMWSPTLGDHHRAIWSYHMRRHRIIFHAYWPASLEKDYGNASLQSVMERIDQRDRDIDQMCGRLFGRQILQNEPYAISDADLLSWVAQRKHESIRPQPECSMGGYDGNDSYLAYHPDSSRVYTIDGSIIEGEISVVALGQTAEQIPLKGKLLPHILVHHKAASDTEKERATLIERFEYQPSATLLYEAYTAYLDGEREPIGFVTWDTRSKAVITQNRNQSRDFK